MGPVIIIVVLLGLAWLVFLVPARRRQRSHQAMQDAVVTGDEIITAGGIHGIVREVEDDELRIEIAPGIVVTLDRRAVAAVAQELPAPVDDPTPATSRGKSSRHDVRESGGK